MNGWLKVNTAAAGPLPVAELAVWIVDMFSVKTNVGHLGSETWVHNKRGL